MTELTMPPGQLRFDRFDPCDERRREALFALGNGVLSWRASAPEAAVASDRRWHYAGFYRAGWYDAAPRQVNGTTVNMAALVNLPDPFGLSLSVDGGLHWFNSETVTFERYQQVLDQNRMVLRRHLVFRLGGHRIELDEERLLSLAEPDLAVLRWQLRLPQALRRVRLRSVLDGDVQNALIERNRPYEGPRLRQVELEHDGADAAVSACLDDPDRRLALAVRTLAPGAARWEVSRDGQRLVLETELAVPAGGDLCVEKRVRVGFDAEIPSDPARARQRLRAAIPDCPWSALELAHRQAWEALWGELTLRSPDQELQRTLRFHACHLLQTLSPHSPARDLGFPARGWHEGYYGQVFWDEIFAVPFLATRFPAIARGILDYRYRRLDQARANAAALGLRGALFPWRSARTGAEETPPFQCNPLSGHWMRDDTALQRHIGAAIVYDAWTLWLATGDDALLAGPVAELTVEVARFWASLARYDERRQRFVICGVIGPDEYHNAYPDADDPGLDNNAYTNLMAVWTLCRALEVLQRLAPEQACSLTERLGIDDEEVAAWDRLSRRLYLPLRDDGTLSQFEGFDDLEEPPREWLEGDRPRLDWMLEARGDSCDRYQLTKQADTLMLLHLFTPPELAGLFERLGYPMDEAQMVRTARYHLAHVTHESSLSLVVCAGALAGLDGSASWAHFHRSLRIDLDAAPDSGTIEGIHLGAMAGSLDVLQRHYLGVQPVADGLRLRPAPPAELPDVALTVRYRDARLHVALDGSQLHVTAAAENPAACLLLCGEERRSLAPGERMTLALDRSQPACNGLREVALERTWP